jgi:hypothetical protein
VLAVSAIRSRGGDGGSGRSRSVSWEIISVLLRHVVLVRRGELGVVDGGQMRVALVGRHSVG